MALVPFAGAAAAGAARAGFFSAVAALMRSSLAKWASAALTGAEIADVINLDVLHRDAIRIAPGASEDAIKQVAMTSARMLGLGPDQVLWPVHRRGANAGKPITPGYFHLNLNNGQAWFTTSYTSFKSARRFSRRRFGRSSYRGRSAPSVQINKG